jgi:hypothetical protein
MLCVGGRIAMRGLRTLSAVAVGAAGITGLLVAAPAAPARAQDDAAEDEAPAPKDPRAAWEALRSARAALRTAQQAKDAAATRELRTKEAAAERAFVASFAASDWDAFDAARDRDLLDQGLLLAGADALGRDDPKAAVRAFDAYLAKLPKGDAAPLVEGVHLPQACIAAGDVERAVPLLEKHAESLFSHVRAAALVQLGDVRAARDGVDAARATWTQVEGLPAPTSGHQAFGRAKLDAALRLALVGAAAPEIPPGVWLGGEAKPLSALRGSVVVVDFFATWGASCRRGAKRMSALCDARRERGLVVLGVTRFFDHGFVPTEGAKDPVTQGDQLGPMTAEEFHDHLGEYRKNLALPFPLVTATAAEFKTWRVDDVPFTAAVDRKGDVAFVKAGGSDTLLRVAVDRLLADAPPK